MRCTIVVSIKIQLCALRFTVPLGFTGHCLYQDTTLRFTVPLGFTGYLSLWMIRLGAIKTSARELLPRIGNGVQETTTCDDYYSRPLVCLPFVFHCSVVNVSTSESSWFISENSFSLIHQASFSRPVSGMGQTIVFIIHASLMKTITQSELKRMLLRFVEFKRSILST
jgi:hypothetical protein